MSRTNFNYKFYSSTNFLKLKFLYKKKNEIKNTCHAQILIINFKV